MKVKRSTGADVDGFVASKPEVPASASTSSPDAANGDDKKTVGASEVPPAPRERQPYVPKSVRMRGRQAPPGTAAATELSSGGYAATVTATGTATGSRAGAPPQAMNFYTFEAQWNSLGRSGGAAARIPLLRRIGAKGVPTLFRESLDAELLASIVQVLQAALEAKPKEDDLEDLSSGSTEDSSHFAADVMDALVKTQRFDLSIGGLSRSERASCGEVLERLEAQGVCSEDTLDRLREAFKPAKASEQTRSAEDLDDVEGSLGFVPVASSALGDEEFDPDDVPEQPTFNKASGEKIDESLHSEFVASSSVGGAGSGAYISLDDCD